jgi:hypothetical protein
MKTINATMSAGRVIVDQVPSAGDILQFHPAWGKGKVCLTWHNKVDNYIAIEWEKENINITFPLSVVELIPRLE